jgi:hypothetical protein
LSPLSFVWCKGKGRTCIDNSSTIGKDKDGAQNASIPNPGINNHDDECPAVHYASAFKRHVTWIWNLQISNTWVNILQSYDYVHAAFIAPCTTPTLALCLLLSSRCSYAYQWVQFLVHGTLLHGGASQPKYAHLAACGDFLDAPLLLANHLELPLPPTFREQCLIIPAQADHFHRGVPALQLGRPHQSTFVDDTAQAKLRENIRSSIHTSEQAAYVLLGRPGEN